MLLKFKDVVRYPHVRVGVSSQGGPACLAHAQGYSWSGCGPDGPLASSICIQFVMIFYCFLKILANIILSIFSDMNAMPCLIGRKTSPYSFNKNSFLNVSFA